MLVNTKGIVLRNTKFSDNSIITAIYTRQLGMKSFIVSGVHSPKAALKPSLLLPLTLLELIVYNKPGRDLQRIKEAQNQPPLHTLHFDVMKSTVGVFIAELIYRSVREEEPNEELFDFIFNFILSIDTSDNRLTNEPLYFLIALTRYLGFYPHCESYAKDYFFNLANGEFEFQQSAERNSIGSEGSGYLYKMLTESKETIRIMQIPKGIRLDLLRKMLDYYLIHLPGFHDLKSVSVLQGLLSE